MIDYDKAIERLRAETDKSIPGVLDVANAFMGTGERWTPSTMRDALIELLETARDSIPLPKDKNGETIHMDDMMENCGYRYPVRRLFYLAGIGGWRVGDLSSDPLNLDGLYDPETLTHYNEPTIKDVLRDFLSAVEEAKRKGYDDVPDEEYVECAERLREVMADD